MILTWSVQPSSVKQLMRITFSDQDSGFGLDSERRFGLDKEAKRQFAKSKAN